MRMCLEKDFDLVVEHDVECCRPTQTWVVEGFGADTQVKAIQGIYLTLTAPCYSMLQHASS